MGPISCTHRPPCPGCPRLGVRGPLPTAIAALGALAGSRKATTQLAIEPPVVGRAQAFRTRARLAVRGRARSPKIGIFEQGSHQIVDIPRCPIHHPLVNQVAHVLREALRATGVAPYVDHLHRGQLRYLQVSIDGDDRAQVVLVGCGTEASALEPLVEPLRSALGDKLHSLFWNGQPERDNRILGPRWHRFFGPEALCEVHDGTRVFYPPGAFRQSHADLASQLGQTLREWLPKGGRIVEYFAGSGALGLPLAARGATVTFNEREGESLRGLAMGIADLDDAARMRTRVLEGAAEAEVGALLEADCALLDPPRRGVGDALVEALRTSPVSRIAYVSCGLDSFLREAAALCEPGGFTLTRLAPFDFFPYGDHIETLALLERNGAQR